MAYPDYIRQKARQMRSERRMTLDEIAERLAINKSTVWYWIRDIEVVVSRRAPSGEPQHLAAAREKAARVNSEKYEVLRREAYARGWLEFGSLKTRNGFTDFVCMYIGEGYKKCRNQVAIANSDPKVLQLANYWLGQLTEKELSYSIQYHADQDVEYLRRFWSYMVGFEPEKLRLQRKSNSNQMKGRTWRSKWGVLTIGASDTYLRCRLQAWMDRVRDSWVDSIIAGV